MACGIYSLTNSPVPCYNRCADGGVETVLRGRVARRPVRRAPAISKGARLTQAGSVPSVETKQRPIVPFLRLDERPHLVGSRCKACGQTFVGLRRNCARCTAIDQMEEIRLSDRGEVWVWT